MPKQIQDEFTGMKITRQRRYQLRREKEGNCRVCGRKALLDAANEPLGLCKKHAHLQAKTCRRNAQLMNKPGAEFI